MSLWKVNEKRTCVRNDNSLCMSFWHIFLKSENTSFHVPDVNSFWSNPSFAVNTFSVPRQQLHRFHINLHVQHDDQTLVFYRYQTLVSTVSFVLINVRSTVEWIYGHYKVIYQEPVPSELLDEAAMCYGKSWDKFNFFLQERSCDLLLEPSAIRPLLCQCSGPIKMYMEAFLLFFLQC